MITEAYGQSIHLFWNIAAALLAIATMVVAYTLPKKYKTTKWIIYALSIGILVVDIPYIFFGKWILTHWILNVLGMIGGIIAILLGAGIDERKYIFHSYYIVIWGMVALFIDGFYVLLAW